MTTQSSGSIERLAKEVEPRGVQLYREALKTMGRAESPEVTCLANELGLPGQQATPSPRRDGWMARPAFVVGSLLVAYAVTAFLLAIVAIRSEEDDVLFVIPAIAALLTLVIDVRARASTRRSTTTDT